MRPERVYQSIVGTGHPTRSAACCQVSHSLAAVCVERFWGFALAASPVHGQASGLLPRSGSTGRHDLQFGYVGRTPREQFCSGSLSSPIRLRSGPLVTRDSSGRLMPRHQPAMSGSRAGLGPTGVRRADDRSTGS
jgi:hypothetical protein